MNEDVRFNRKTNYVPHQLTNISVLVYRFPNAHYSCSKEHFASGVEKKQIKAIWLIVADETRLSWSSSTEFNWNKFFHTLNCVRVCVCLCVCLYQDRAPISAFHSNPIQFKASEERKSRSKTFSFFSHFSSAFSPQMFGVCVRVLALIQMLVKLNESM